MRKPYDPVKRRESYLANRERDLAWQAEYDAVHDPVRREKRRLRIITYLGGVCTHPDCSQTYIPGLHRGDYRKLECHHVDPATKLFEVMSGVNLMKKWSTVKRELDKCVLLCKKHHDEHHHGITQPTSNNTFENEENEHEDRACFSEHGSSRVSSLGA